MNQNVQPHSNAWVTFTYVSFAASAFLVLCAMVTALLLTWTSTTYWGAMELHTVIIACNQRLRPSRGPDPQSSG